METAHQHEQDEISLTELLKVIYRSRWLVVCSVVFFTFSSGVAVYLSPKTYKAATVISPVSDSSSDQMGGLNSLASQFGGLASLAGISLAGNSKKSESLAVLQSGMLAEKYLQKNNLLPILFSKKWDAEKSAWSDPEPERVPTLWKASQYFRKRICSISTDNKTGLVTLTVKWTDPKLAAKWANELVKLTNDYLRAQALEQSERNIAYLNGEAVKTDIVSVREAIYSILKNEINKSMVARGTDEYAFKVIDPAVPPETPSSPQSLLWILGGFMFGLGLPLLIAFIHVAWR